MADTNFPLSDNFENQIVAHWGTLLAWKKWAKTATRAALRDAALDKIDADAFAARSDILSTAITDED